MRCLKKNLEGFRQGTETSIYAICSTTITTSICMRDYKTSVFIKTIGITEDDYEWIQQIKGKKSAAGFLKQLIEEYRKPNLFKRKK